MQGNAPTTTAGHRPIPCRNVATLLSTETQTAISTLAASLRVTADLIEQQAELIAAHHDLLASIHNDLIATGGSVRVETADQLVMFLAVTAEAQ